MISVIYYHVSIFLLRHLMDKKKKKNLTDFYMVLLWFLVT